MLQGSFFQCLLGVPDKAKIYILSSAKIKHFANYPSLTDEFSSE